GKKIIEPTSGNTGIGLIAVANLKNYEVRNTISTQIPEEKKTILKFLGSELIEVPDSLCPDPNEPGGAIGIAKSTVKKLPDKYFMPNQYENEANIEAHYKTTAPEIWSQTKGKVTHVIAGLGTCGTIGGISKFLKEKNPDIKIIAVHPQENHDIPGVRSLKQLKVTKLFDPNLYNDMIEVTNKEAYDMCLRLNREESIIAGPSSGMVLAGAIKALNNEKKGILNIFKKNKESTVILIFPDNIFKYTTFLAKNFPDIIQVPQKTQNPMIENLFSEMIQISRNEYNTTNVEEAKKFIERENPEIIDVRPSFVYSQAHIPNAKNIPVDKLIQEKESLPKDKSRPILTVCQAGNTSLIGTLLLKALGYNNVKSIEKGTTGWIEKGYPVEK
ncbi:MAG: pyridoxal-phosphate dependent enzyme, partial [Nanoarchaeota archaeon]